MVEKAFFWVFLSILWIKKDFLCTTPAAGKPFVVKQGSVRVVSKILELENFRTLELQNFRTLDF